MITNGFLKNFIKSITPKYILTLKINIKKQTKNFEILANTYGQYNSIKKWSCVDVEGDPIPWYTYPAIEYLSHLDFSKMRIFEYGSGNSTLWWTSRSMSVTSVEEDFEWYEKIKNKISLKYKNKLIYYFEKNKKSYISKLASDNEIIIIDGNYRKECAEHILVSENYYNSTAIVFDNSDWYPETITFLREKLGWVQMDFHGFGPINNYTWTTSIFVRPDKVNDLKYSKNLKSIAGLEENAEI